MPDTPSRRGQSWTDEEERELWERWSQGQSTEALAVHFERSNRAIELRLEKLRADGVPPDPAVGGLRAVVVPGEGFAVCETPGTTGRIQREIPAGTTVQLTGSRRKVDDVWWWEITDRHWVSGVYLNFSPSADTERLPQRPRPPSPKPRLHTGDTPDESVRFLQRIRDLDSRVHLQPERADLYRRRAEAYAVRARAMGDLPLAQQAIINLAEAIRRDPQIADAAFYQVRGSMYRVLGNLGLALQDSDASIRLDPSNAEAYEVRGLTCAALRDVDQAIEAFTEALRLEPENMMAKRGLQLALQARPNELGAPYDVIAAESNGPDDREDPPLPPETGSPRHAAIVGRGFSSTKAGLVGAGILFAWLVGLALLLLLSTYGDGGWKITKRTSTVRSSSPLQNRDNCLSSGHAWNRATGVCEARLQPDLTPTATLARQPTEPQMSQVTAARTPSPTGTPASKGPLTNKPSRIAYSSGGSVYVMDTDGGNVRQLTMPYLASSGPAWSPDGTRIAFTSVGRRQDCCFKAGPDYSFIISVMDANGSNLRMLTEGDSPAWSPDGTRIAFTRADGIYLVDTDGGNVRPLSPNSQDVHPTWSPDGTRIAFASVGVIWVMDANGRNVQKLTEGESAAWSPDGSQIAFTRADGLYVVGTDGGNVRQLTAQSQDAHPTWSPDGSSIAFARADGIYVMEGPGTFRKLAEGDSPAWSPVLKPGLPTSIVSPATPTGTATPMLQPTTNTSPALSTRGRRSIVFSSDRDGDFDIYIMDFRASCKAQDASRDAMCESDNVRQLTSDKSRDLSPTWSSDGTQIAFASNRVAGISQIYVMDVDGGNISQLTSLDEGGYGPDWSPDGTQIVFSGRNSLGGQSIYVMDSDGQNVRQLTVEPDSATQPDWSPDGTKIAFVGRPSGEFNPKIYVMDANGLNQKRLTSSETSYEAAPAWSPDGTRIAYMSNRNVDDPQVSFEIFVMDADGSNVQLLISSPRWDGDPAWSSDGSQIAFWSDRESNQPNHIYVMDVKGLNGRKPEAVGLRRLTKNHMQVQQTITYNTSPDWSPTT